MLNLFQRKAPTLPPSIKCELLDGYLHKAIVSSLDKQFKLQNFVKNNCGKNWKWFVDFDEKVLTLGKHKFKSIQLLGSNSFISNTWRWSWYDPENVNDLPEEIKQNALKLQEIGKKQNIEAFTRGSFSTTPDMAGNGVAIIASYILDFSCYYSMPTGNNKGMAYITIKDPRIDDSPGASSTDEFKQLFFMLQDFPGVNAYKAIKHYVDSKQLSFIKVESKDDTFTLTLPNQMDVVLRFNNNRVVGFSYKVEGKPKMAPK